MIWNTVIAKPTSENYRRCRESHPTSIRTAKMPAGPLAPAKPGVGPDVAAEPGPPAAVCGLAADLQPAPARAHAAGGAGLQQPSPTPRTAHAEKTAPCRGTIASVTRLELRPRCPDVTKPTSNSSSQL